MSTFEISDIFKEEYSNLIAVLFHHYGLNDMQLAEDIVSDTFLIALKSWSHKGVPTSPKAWLRKVAQNKLKDHFRRKKTFDTKVVRHISSDEETAEIEITDEIIQDSQLRMIFVVCDPALSSESQICLALRILCGFNIEEIAMALLSNKETISKKLYRAKKSIKAWKHLETHLSTEQYIDRLDNVLRVLYLLFSEGYYSSVHEENIRHDICWNAMRLAIFLSQQKIFPKQHISALIALMCFHSSRLHARSSGVDGDLLYEDQDRSLWDKELIRKGEKYLNQSAQGEVISKYHLEAAIAYWHTCEGEEKWEHILQLYNRLLMLEYSPIIALNRTYAFAKANSVDEAIKEALKLSQENNHLYHCLVAELFRMNGNRQREKEYLNKALTLAKKENERDLIQAKISSSIQAQKP